MQDRVFIEGLLVHAAHGVCETERTEPQDFLVDISALFDVSVAGKSDNVEDTLDYGRLRDVVQRVFAGEPRYLLENLASRIAAEVLADPRTIETTVTIRKPVIYKDCVPGVSITRRRPFSL